MSSIFIDEYSKSTQNCCICLASVSLLILLVTLIKPSKIGKMFIIIILGFMLIYNYNQTNKFATNMNINMYSFDLSNPLKINILCSYVFLLFVIFLMVSLLRKLLV